MIKHSLVLIVFAASAAIGGDALIYNFDLTVRTGAGESQHVVEALSAGTNKVVDVSSTLKVDLTAPADGVSPTIVRLIDTSGAEPKVLHTAQRGGSAEVRRTSTYTVCKEGVYFESPTPDVPTSKCRN